MKNEALTVVALLTLSAVSAHVAVTTAGVAGLAAGIVTAAAVATTSTKAATIAAAGAVASDVTDLSALIMWSDLKQHTTYENIVPCSIPGLRMVHHQSHRSHRGYRHFGSLATCDRIVRNCSKSLKVVND
jgi:hypothetical protein